MVRISEKCVIIHNLLIKMSNSGTFGDEVGAGEDATTIIDEFWAE